MEVEIQRLLDVALFRGQVVALKIRLWRFRCWTVSLSRSLEATRFSDAPERFLEWEQERSTDGVGTAGYWPAWRVRCAQIAVLRESRLTGDNACGSAHAHRRLLVVSEEDVGVLNDELLKRLTGDSVVPLNAICTGSESTG